MFVIRGLCVSYSTVDRVSVKFISETTASNEVSTVKIRQDILFLGMKCCYGIRQRYLFHYSFFKRPFNSYLPARQSTIIRNDVAIS